jgi:hypothetical protein
MAPETPLRPLNSPTGLGGCGYGKVKITVRVRVVLESVLVIRFSVHTLTSPSSLEHKSTQRTAKYAYSNPNLFEGLDSPRSLLSPSLAPSGRVPSDRRLPLL